MEGTMKFAVIMGPKRAEVHERPIPEIGDGDVLVRLNVCNICTSDYGQWNGSRSNQPLPMAGGHENSGVIVEKGGNVGDELQIGDQVSFGYYFCGNCESCRSGNTAECTASVRFPKSDDGFYGPMGFAEYFKAFSHTVVKVDKKVEPEHAAFLEPIATVNQGIRRLHIQPSETVVVIGAGTMGLLNAQLARLYTKKIVITEMMEKKIACAKALGFENVVNISESDPAERVKEFTGGKGADVVIIAVGNSSANAQALQVAKKAKARILYFAAGYPEPELNMDSNALHYSKHELIGTFGADIQDFQTAAKLLEAGDIDMWPLLEGKFYIDDIQKAYELANTPGSYRVSVLLQPEK